MKPHLPLSLITALLLSMPMAQAVDIPSAYKQIELWKPSSLKDGSTLNGDYTNNTEKEAYAFLLCDDIDFTPQTKHTWTTEKPLIKGGQLLFTSASSLETKELSFRDGHNRAFSSPASLAFDTLRKLSFTDFLTATYDGDNTIYLSTNTSLSISHVTDNDDETADVIFSDNHTTRKQGAAIKTGVDASIDLHDCGGVLFSGNQNNSTGDAESGAIYSRGTISFCDNHSLTFRDNSARTRAFGSYSGWYAASGGAIRTDAMQLAGNTYITVSGNCAEAVDIRALGGAIHAQLFTLRDSTSVIFQRNHAAANTEGHSNFSYGSIKGLARGGALYANQAAFTAISELLLFDNNSVYNPYEAKGGALYGNDISLTLNHMVVFSENKAEKNSTASGSAACGGAIYATTVLNILGNDSVCFEKNYEQSATVYRLRSLYAEVALSLSAKTGGDITFYDSVYVGSRTTLNADYQDAEGVLRRAEGDIVFSGRYTAEHLREIKGSDATEAEISASRTSTLGETELCGGSLHIVDGAVVKAGQFTVLADSAAKLLMRDGTLSCSNSSGTGHVTLNSGNTLELQGSNSLTADRLTLGSGTTLVAHLSEENLSKAAMELGSTRLESSQLTLQLERRDGLRSGLFRIIGLSSSSYFAPTASWTADNIQVVGSGDAARASFADLLWQNGTLYYRVSRNLWDNGSGDGLWNSRSDNWSMNDRRYTYADGMDVSFTDTAAGELRLAGELRPADILVHNSEGQDYRFTAAEGGGYLAGSTGITKEGSGELALATDNRHTGDTVLNGGTLRVQHSRALGATAEGLAAIRSAAGTALVIENGSRVVLAGSNALAGAVSVAEGAALELRHTGYNAESSAVQGELRFCGAAADTTAGSLSGSGSVLAEDSRVSFGSLSGFTGNLRVSGENARLSVSSGNYNGRGSLSVRGSGAALDLGSNNLSLRSGGSLALSSDGEAAQLVAKNVSLAAGASLSTAYLLPESSELGQDLFLVSSAESEELTGVFNSRVSASLDCSLLTLTAGSSLSLQGGNFGLNGATLTLAVTPTATQKIELTLVPMDAPEAKVLLFTEVGKVNFIYDNQQPNSATGGLHSFAAADYFSGAWIHEDTQLIYDAGAQQLYLTQVNSVVPEPSSATLSLTALAALLLRRRRR